MENEKLNHGNFLTLQNENKKNRTMSGGVSIPRTSSRLLNQNL